MSAESIQRVASGLINPEGPCVHPDGRVFVCESERAVSWHGPDGTRGDLVSDMAPNGAAFGPDEALYIAEWRQKAIVRADLDGQLSTVVDEYGGCPLNGPNDICFLPDGACYFTDPAREGESLEAILTNPNGRVFHMDQKGVLTEVAAGIQFSNGVQWTLERKHLLVCESGLNRILRYPVLADGRLGNHTVFIDGLPGWPDGMCMDAAGNVYAAVYGSGTVFHISPGGSVLQELTLPGNAVSNCALGGPDRRTLYITEMETGSLYSLPVEVPGVPLFPFINAFEI